MSHKYYKYIDLIFINCFFWCIETTTYSTSFFLTFLYTYPVNQKKKKKLPSSTVISFTPRSTSLSLPYTPELVQSEDRHEVKGGTISPLLRS